MVEGRVLLPDPVPGNWESRGDQKQTSLKRDSLDLTDLGEPSSPLAHVQNSALG